MPGWEISRKIGRVTEVLDPFELWSHRPERGRLRGLHSDDTQQAWILASILLARGSVDPGALVARFVAFAKPRPGLPHGIHRGTGRGFRAAVERMAGGAAPLEAGEPTAGNGAAMRIAPVGIVHGGSADRIVAEALLASVTTHRDARALEAAAALAALVGALVAPAPPADPLACLEAAMDGARRAEDLLAQGKPTALSPAERSHSGGVRSVLAAVAALGDAPADRVLAQVAARADQIGPDRPVRRGTEAFAPASVVSAIGVACRAASLRDALETMVSAGGDTDTTGAMAGAVAGARFGAGAIPTSWMEVLVGRDPLERVARALSGEMLEVPDQEPLEESWTRLERAQADRRAGLVDPSA